MREDGGPGVWIERQGIRTDRVGRVVQDRDREAKEAAPVTVDGYEESAREARVGKAIRQASQIPHLDGNVVLPLVLQHPS